MISTIPQNLSELGQVRGTVLSLNLDNATKGTTTSQAVNKTGYLTALSKLPINSSEDIFASDTGNTFSEDARFLANDTHSGESTVTYQNHCSSEATSTEEPMHLTTWQFP